MEFEAEGRRLTIFPSGEIALDLGWARGAVTVPTAPDLRDDLERLRRDDAGSFVWDSACGRVELAFVMAKYGELGLTATLRGPECLDTLSGYLPLRRDGLGRLLDGAMTVPVGDSGAR